MITEKEFMKAADDGDLATLRQFFVEGGDVNCRNGHGCTAVQKAAVQGHLECLKYLISIDADLNITDVDGDTPLLDAAMKGRADSVRRLLAAEADPKIVNKKGHTAESIARERGHFDVVRVIEDYTEIKMPDEIVFTRSLRGKILDDIYDFVHFERISIIYDEKERKIECMTRQSFADLSEKSLKAAFNEHVQRGGKCTLAELGISGTIEKYSLPDRGNL